MNKFTIISFIVILSSCGSPSVSTIKPTFKTPEMVIVQSGEYIMGDSSGVGQSDEKPPHSVKISSFAISRNEITFAEYSQYVIDSQKRMPSDSGWGKGRKPVINVSWNDAQNYVKWLSQKTGDNYRLPSESEWEYAAKAGSSSLFSHGNNEKLLCKYANIADQQAIQEGANWVVTECNDENAYTAIVGSYPPNSFLIYDMSGNVWEWVADCWHDNYTGAPSNNSTWSNESCDQHVIRGGSFQQTAQSARNSNREKLNSTKKLNQLGFRIAKTL